MTKTSIYLDNAATTPLRPEVAEAMAPFLKENYGNPSSLHTKGREANKALDAATQEIAGALNTTPESIIYTAGGSEANNLALKGIAWGLAHKGKHLITSAIEHPSILEPCKWLETQGFEVTYLHVEEEGFVSTEDLKNAIRPDTILVSIMHGNNEVGTLQSIETLGGIAREKGVLFHTDAVQTLGKLSIDLSTLPVDLLSASGHKLQGPKGVGILIANTKAQEALVPVIHGGGQQQGFRSGTENLAAIIGFQKALTLAVLEQEQTVSHLLKLQTLLIDGILTSIPHAKFHGPRDMEKRVPGNVHFSFAPVEGEALVLRADLAGLCISSGSACHSASLEGSHVLLAMGATEQESKSTLRFSLGRENTAEDIKKVIEVLPAILEKTGYFKHHPKPVTMVV